MAAESFSRLVGLFHDETCIMNKTDDSSDCAPTVADLFSVPPDNRRSYPAFWNPAVESLGLTYESRFVRVTKKNWQKRWNKRCLDFTIMIPFEPTACEPCLGTEATNCRPLFNVAAVVKPGLHCRLTMCDSQCEFHTL